MAVEFNLVNDNLCEVINSKGRILYYVHRDGNVEKHLGENENKYTHINTSNYSDVTFNLEGNVIRGVHRLVYICFSKDHLLTPENQIHHLDGDPTNNSFDNLKKASDHSEHRKFHLIENLHEFFDKYSDEGILIIDKDNFEIIEEFTKMLTSMKISHEQELSDEVIGINIFNLRFLKELNVDNFKKLILTYSKDRNNYDDGNTLNKVEVIGYQGE